MTRWIRGTTTTSLFSLLVEGKFLRSTVHMILGHTVVYLLLSFKQLLVSIICTFFSISKLATSNRNNIAWKASFFISRKYTLVLGSNLLFFKAVDYFFTPCVSQVSGLWFFLQVIYCSILTTSLVNIIQLKDFLNNGDNVLWELYLELGIHVFVGFWVNSMN